MDRATVGWIVIVGAAAAIVGLWFWTQASDAREHGEATGDGVRAAANGCCGFTIRAMLVLGLLIGAGFIFSMIPSCQSSYEREPENWRR